MFRSHYQPVIYALVTRPSHSTQETYPSTAPVWFSECEDVQVTSTLAWLSESSRDNHVLAQVYHLIGRLCTSYDLPLPSDLARITIPMQARLYFLRATT